MSQSRLRSLGLPDGIGACLFDLDGVLTETATVHASAWKEMFDDLLRRRAAERYEPFVEFDLHADYDTFVDGKIRSDGTRSFLAARGIVLPEGSPGDPATAQTVVGLGRLKNSIVLRRLGDDGVTTCVGAVAYVRAVRDAGLGRAVVSASKNCAAVLAAAGIADLFDVRVDGFTAEADHLAGKPAPDLFVSAAKALGIAPAHAAVFEDALAGVRAGRAGAFGYVVGIGSTGRAAALTSHGADIVVADLGALLARRPS